MKTVDELELWKCKKEIGVAQKSYKEDEHHRKILIEKDEIVEFRYHHSVHFRTIDDIYCVLSEDVFYEHFEPYGKIYKDVKFANNCKLSDIIRLGLFHKEPKIEWGKKNND
jgi:hypothetical protein